MLKVFAHKTPDTDATCSPIVYAWYLSEKMGQEAEAFISGKPNKEALFVLDKFDIELPAQLDELTDKDRIVVVDTNNPEELPDGVSDAEIVEIIDHHKLVGGLSTDSPIRITIKPIACTATIVWQRMQEDDNHDIEPKMAGLLLSAILSDTLKFSSPTTTDEDKTAAEELAEIADENIDSLADEMFAAKSDLTGFGAEDILLTDSKVFDMAGKKVRISVLETTLPENAIKLKGDLIESMEALKKKERLDAIFFFIVDIMNTAADLVVSADMEMDIAERAFEGVFKSGVMHLDGVVSRKKQMSPNIEKAIG
ncbi:MAG: manganese-dependent inorganic pyrophosphatase [Candidatus Dojkabacteria bacterium]